MSWSFPWYAPTLLWDADLHVVAELGARHLREGSV